ncbi:MAG: DUF1559 domain-containing protein [Verrucomicrobiae bacterium]|nr:DUF1559 domain-containing protein [Verrucomicrobiae bacterium]
MNVFIGVGVCLIVALMFLPTHSGRVRDQARRAMCLNNLKQIGVSLRLYREDNSGRLPCDVNSTVLGSFALLINNYQTSYKTWICPSDPGILAGSAFNPWTTSNLSYAYGGFELTAGVQPDTPSVCDRSSSGNPTGPTPWQNNMWTHKYDGGNVLFADGHVAFVKTMTPPMYRGKNP